MAAYREERGYADETEPIGPAPECASPEQRASWHAAYAALRLPEHDREVASAADGELWAQRAAYQRETKWAPPYVGAELREAHIAEDTYRADAVRAWHRADAAAGGTEWAQAQREAEEYGALAQEVGAHREALEEIAAARRAWHAATELDRQKAMMADTELRRRHPDAELPPLHPDEEPHRDPDAEPIRGESRIDSAAEFAAGRESEARRDLNAALAAARRAQQIIAERDLQAVRDVALASDDVMRRREAEAQQETAARHTAVRQDPAPSRRTMSLERDEPELEAGL